MSADNALGAPRRKSPLEELAEAALEAERRTLEREHAATIARGTDWARRKAIQAALREFDECLSSQNSTRH